MINNEDSLTLVERCGEAAASSGELPTPPLTNCGCNLFFFLLFLYSVEAGALLAVNIAMTHPTDKFRHIMRSQTPG